MQSGRLGKAGVPSSQAELGQPGGAEVMWRWPERAVAVAGQAGIEVQWSWLGSRGGRAEQRTGGMDSDRGATERKAATVTATQIREGGGMNPSRGAGSCSSWVWRRGSRQGSERRTKEAAAAAARGSLWIRGEREGGGNGGLWLGLERER